MKIMIASDIHGSAFFCRKLTDAFSKELPQKLLLLGDILYHGPRNALPDEYSPQKTAELLNALSERILCVRGNCDSEVDQMLLKFPIMADYCLLCIDSTTVFATHGHIYNKDNLPPIQSGDVFISGHTHIPVAEASGDSGVLFLNPGSVSIPKENSRNGYMVFENGVFYWKDLDCNIYNTYAL